MSNRKTHPANYTHLLIVVWALLNVSPVAADLINSNDASRFVYEKSEIVIEYIVTPKMRRARAPAIYLRVYGDGALKVESYGNRLEGAPLSQDQLLKILVLFEGNGLLNSRAKTLEADLRDFRRSDSDRGAIADGGTVELRIHLERYRPANSTDVISEHHRSIKTDNPLAYAKKYPEVESIVRFAICVAELHALYLIVAANDLDEATRKELFK